MSDITLRLVKGSPLTNQEVDDNFSNLNADKYQAGDSASFQDVTLDNMSGPIAWNVDDGTLDVPLNASVTLQVGQEFVFYGKATEAIANGDLVMFAGAQGGHLLISKCDMGSTGFDPTYIVGVATQAFAANDFGYVTAIGKVRDLNTLAYAEGTVLYADPSTAGGLSATKPTPPNHAVQVAAVVRSHGTQGTLQVRLTHMPDTDEVPEGTTNLYFTDARAVSAIQGDASWNASDWDTAYGWGDHSTQGYATESYVGTAVSNLVDSAPATLDTLNELAAALGDDPNFATTVSTSIGTKWTQDNTKISNWDTAYGWGNHASAGYLTSIPTPTSGNFWNGGFIRVGTDGVMEVGKYLDFHTSDAGGNGDFDLRVTASPGALTIGGSISASSVGVTNIVTNKVVKFNGTILDDSNITDTGSEITLGSNTTVSGTLDFSGGSSLSNATQYIKFKSTSTTGGFQMLDSADNLRGYFYFDSTGIGILEGGSWGLKVDYSGNNFATTSSRAPIFYDTNNTAYYTNPASTSVLNGLNVTTINRDPTVTLSGDVTGSATMTNLGSINIVTTVADNSHSHNYLVALDDRDMKPNTSGIGANVKGLRAFFSSYGGMTGTANTDYQDVLVLDTYSDSSGGNATALTFDKSDGTMRIWSASQTATSWGTPKIVWTDADFSSTKISNWDTAYTYSQVGHLPLAGGTITGLLIAEDGIRIGTGNHNTDGRASLTFGEGTTTGDSMYIEYDGENLSGDANAIIFGSSKDGVGDIMSVTYGGSVKIGSNAVFHDGYHPNADTWTTARTNTVTLTGDVSGTGSASVNGSGNWTVSITTAVANDSHSHSNYVEQLADTTSPNYQASSSRRVDPNASNPTNEHYAVITFGNEGNVTGQLATHFVSGQPYTRGYNSGWSAWRKIWTDSNDGSGSGLDADLLDGQHGSYYAPATGGNYVAKSGDTMTGALTYTKLVGPDASSRDKIRVYSSSLYTIGMQSGVTYGGLNDWAMTFQFNNDTDRGFWWGHENHTTAQGAMSLTTAGHLFVGSRVDAPVFYDSNDTGFFLDPNASGDPATTSLKIRGGIRWHTDELDFSVGVHSGMEPMSLRIWDNYTQTGAPQTYGTVLDIYGRSGHWRHQFHYLGSDLQFRSGGYGSETWSGWQSIFHDGYHPNADTWTTARTNTVTLTGDVSGTGSASVNGSGNWTVSISTAVANDSHTHSQYAFFDHIRSLGVTAFTGGANPSITTDQLISEMEGDGAFDSYTSVFKTSWSYAGNYDLTDAGRFTETAGTSWITWTDSSSDTTRGTITALAIAPNTGGSAGKVFIYNDQGSGYSPGWREVWTSASDGSGSGLDADLLDGQHGSYYATASSLTSYLPLSGGTMTGTLNYRTLENQQTSNYDTAGDSSGFSVFYGTSSATSKPSGTDHAVTTLSFSSAWQVQEAADWRTNARYIRKQENGTWSSWQRLFADDYHPNADKWTTARTNTVTLTGDVTGTGSASVNGSGNWTVSISTAVANDSHSHSNYVLKAGDTMTGDLVTTSGDSNGIFIGTNGANITSVTPSSKDVVVQDCAQFRMGGASWDWNAWAGWAWAGGTNPIYFGGPASTAFNSNASPPTPPLLLSGVSYTQSDGSMRAPIFYDSDNTSYYANFSSVNRSINVAGGIHQTETHRPNVQWSSTSATGAVLITLPGTSSQYDMVSIEIDVYEYNSTAGSKIYISGHNWNTGWFNNSVQVIGSFNKPIYLGRDGNDYFIQLGDVGSGWTYGTVNVTQVTTAGFYSVIDWAVGWNIGLVTTLPTYLQVTTNLNDGGDATLKTNGYIYSPSSVRSPIFYDSNDTNYYVDPSSRSRLLSLTTRNRISIGSNGNLPYEDTGEAGIWYSGTSSNATWFLGLNGATTSADFRFYAGGNRFLFTRGGTGTATADWRAPIFYDSNDTAYYVNPNGTSKLNVVQLASATAELEVYDGATINVYSGTNYAYENYIYGDTSTNYMVIRSVLGNGLHVKNSVNSNGVWIRSNGTVEATGDITAYSDERLKENIKTLDGSKVLQMRGVSFTKDGKEGSGVIAQELEKVAPELVNNEGEFKSVAYGNIVGYLIEAIKEQQSQIEALQIEIKSLKEK